MRLDGVDKRYGIRLPWVVHDVSLDIRPGGLVRFEGRNGSGKSTLLRVIAGVCVPSRGTVTGRPVTGYVPEQFPPALPFPARDYLAHVGRMHGLTGPDLAERIDGCLDRLGGTEFAGVPLRTMSKGMCQKVAVAQALLPRSGLLVLDEAWTGLDVEAKAALDEVVAERLADGGSVVFVDHDPGRLDHLAAQRWRIEHGRATRVENGSGPADRAGAGDVDIAGSGGSGGGGGGAGTTVVIEVTGCPPEFVQVDEAAGVLSAVADGDRLVVRVEPGASDAVLRRLLDAGDGVHVRRVDDEAAPGLAEGDPNWRGLGGAGTEGPR